MNLYLVSQNANVGYDTFDSFVVCCENEEVARNTNPHDGQPINWKDNWTTSGWCNRIEDVQVMFLGVADLSVERGVVCASYNAG